MTPPRRPLRVLMTADTMGGVWRYAIDLARTLGPLGVEMHLATMGRMPSTEQRGEADAAQVPLFARDYRLEWMDDPWADLSHAGHWLRDLAARFPHDIVHLNGYALAGCGFAAPVLIVGHSCVISWWEAVKSEPAPSKWHRYRRVVASGIAAADAVAAPSGAMLQALERHYCLPPCRRVIYNGTATTAHEGVPKQEIVFAAGRLWDEAKNFSLLDAAAPSITWPVHVAGCADHPDGAARPFRHLRLHGSLSQEAVADWLRRAAIYALPARYEPFGLSILEAANAGCALVLGDIASLREIWGDAALFVPVDDAAALARAIQSLIDHPERRNGFAARARHRATRYSMQSTAAQYRALYDELVDSRRRADRHSISA